ncbi:uncharacterized, partial [Tachysurus ichikawai]
QKRALNTMALSSGPQNICAEEKCEVRGDMAFNIYHHFLADHR